ncbi:uncharacterized protein LOC109820062 isoform X2 [Asparagus officinalis]|uniref:uncharacterized protein LOC109820062 isoform X1 n=1 Tax=Asparagus officinalis TaxID=4686 RepID=UPI00098E5C3F|nr:uncharacterized protein LOC109820062 isoform X1 [Asparagus officinalis]XP_020241712.1 uncharacterized protein LOC109820062 isoform X2 [Asparagus officinalis]
METATMATAAGVAVMLYLFIGRRISICDPEIDGVDTYSETLGKWPIGDLAFGIKYLMRRQGNQQIACEFAANDCVQLKGPEIMSELIDLLRLLTFCRLFSKQPFLVFLDSAGFSKEDVLIQEPKAGLLRPAFTIICDKSSKSFLLLIRGTHSIKDTLTAATGAVVPFHHLVLHEGGISNLVLGYAHCGMVAAARWIAKCTTPCLLKAVKQHPDYNIKIIGHSLGGGTAALLTYILREREEFSSSMCIAFAPAACMTWDLAESGKHFITTIINGSDLVPSFSTAAFDNLRSEVTASSWLNDLRDQIQNTRFLNVVYRSASALGSHLPSISSAKARVAGASALLHPVSTGTQVMMKRAQNVAQAVAKGRSSFSSWSCMGARRRVIGTVSSAEQDNSNSLLIERVNGETKVDEVDYAYSPSDDEEIEEEELIQDNHVGNGTTAEDMTEGELWFELEKELDGHDEHIQARKEEAAAVKEIIEEETGVLKEAVENKQPATLDSMETHRFYPPGRIMHMVVASREDANSSEGVVGEEGTLGIYETPRDLYNKIRLSPTMINDHYMPMYKKTMELLIEKLGEDESATVQAY